MKLKSILSALLVASLITLSSSPVNAGDARGDQTYMMTLKKSESYSFYIYPKGNRDLTVLFLQGNGSTDIDCFIEDSDGDEFISDQSSTDTCSIAFRPLHEQRMTVTITNLGKKENQVVIFTN